MIAADTITWIAFLGGKTGADVELLDRALKDRQVLMVPVVLSELLSEPKIPAALAKSLADLPSAEIAPGYWERAGILRARVLRKGRRARLGDALIAQFCVDSDLSLVTRDRDFRSFSEAAGLRVLIPSGHAARIRI